MIRAIPVAALVLLTIALGMSAVVKERQLVKERARAAVLALAAENANAERDSTREVALENERVAGLLGDSLRMVEKRVVQLAQRSDAFDRATGRERRGSYTIEVAPAPLWGAFTVPSKVGADTGTRAARFDVRQPPYTIAADVSIPRPPDSARMAVRVELDPVIADVRVGCSPADSLGIRAASISATNPPWATVTFGRVEQAPDVCQPPAMLPRKRFSFKPLALGIGRAADWGGRSDWALFFGAVITWR
jgi:hypothetical protein